MKGRRWRRWAAALAPLLCCLAVGRAASIDDLIRAYPDALAGFEGADLIWRDGTRMPVGDLRPVTSLEREVRNPGDLHGLDTIAHQAAKQFGIIFHEQVLALGSLEDLHSIGNAPQAPPAPPQVPQAPEDTPLQVPPEIERLAGKPERPVRA